MPERNVITSLTGTAAPLLTVASNDQRSIDFTSMFLPRLWKKTTPFITDIAYISANGQTGLDIEMAFEVPKLAHMVYDMCIHHTLLPRTVAAGQVANYVDHLGYAEIEYFRAMFSSNNVYERLGIDLYLRYRKKYSQEKLDTINRLILGDLSTAERTLNFNNGNEMFTDPMMPFSDNFCDALPIVTLSQKTRFLMKTKTLQNIVNTVPIRNSAVSTTGLPSNLDPIELILKTVYLTGPESDILMAMARSDMGISYMIHQEQRDFGTQIATFNNAQPSQVKLSGITKPLKEITWAMIPTNLINNSGFNDFFYFSPQSALGPPPAGMTPYSFIQRWNILANGQIIQRDALRNYTRLYDWYHDNEAPSGDEIFTQNYTLFPHAVNSANGYLDYNTLNNPILNIFLGPGGTGTDPSNPLIPQSIQVIVVAQDYNFWFLKSGNWSRAFN